MSVDKTTSGKDFPITEGSSNKSSSETARKLDAVLSEKGAANAAKTSRDLGAWRALLEHSGIVGKESLNEDSESLDWSDSENVEISSATDRPNGQRYLILNSGS